MSGDNNPASPDIPASLAPLSLAAASAACGVSQVTLRKHLTAGRLHGVKLSGGAHGATWAIDPADLAAFIGERYGRPIDLAGLTNEPTHKPALTTALDVARRQAEEAAGLAARAAEAERAREVAEAAAAELRARLDTTLEELGKYRALTERADAADTRGEGMLTARVAELQHERDAAQAQAEEVAAELQRLKSRGLWARVFGG